MTQSNTQKNPYIVGVPIYEKDKLFGRESLLNSLGDILEDYFSENNESQNQKQNIKVVLLEGQRRIGKTSVLAQIAQLVPENNCVFVSFDLQSHSQSSLAEILHDLAKTIINNIGLETDKFTAPTEEEITRDLDIFQHDFLPIIYQNIENKNLVILLDEFDTVENDDFHNFFRKILIQQPKLCMITVVGRNMIISEKLSSFFRTKQVIDFLDNPSAKALITQRFKIPLIYEQDAITKILELTAGHPYFTQVICFNLFEQAKRNGNWNITSQDVEKIITNAIGNVEGHLSTFWQDWNELERVVISTVAEAQKRAIEQNQIEPIEPFNLLKEYGIQIKELNEASRRLESNGYLSDAKRIKVELIRTWLLEKHQFNQEIQELEKFKEEEVNPIYNEAKSLYQQGKKHDAINIYQQALQINPNHFQTVESLAQTYLEVENFEQAIELYTRAYQFAPTRNKEKLVEALERYGNKLKSEGKLSQAQEKFERILEIDPDKKSIKHKIREIAIKIGRQNNQKPTALQQILSPRLRIIVGTTIAVAGILSVGIGVIGWRTPCLAGKLKVNGLFCEPDSIDISRGEHKLFSDSYNSNLDQGITEFKKGNYSQAANLFKDAVNDNRNDPEVLIYYNNARARQQGKPLTLATVIPADNLPNVGKEILRGVAQAQNQFNDNNGLNSRLLEIAIANDANRREKAKDIAQELVKDPSILGIIGHYTSDATSAALEEYTKARLAIVSPTSTSTSLKSDVFFRTVPSDAATGKILGEYAKKSGINRTVIFYNRYSTYSKSLTQEFTKNFGGFTKRIDLTKPNLNLEQVVQESAKDAQAAVLFPNAEKTYLDKALQVAQANNKLGAQRLQLLGGAAIYNEETLNNARNVIEGLTLEVPWFREAPQSKTFVQKAQAQWGTKWVSWRTATSYDATQALIQALSASPSNASRSTVLQNLPNVTLSVQATSGDELKFQNRERQSQPILVKVEQGELKLLP